MTTKTPLPPDLRGAVEPLMSSLARCVRDGHAIRRTGTSDVLWTGERWALADELRGMSVCSALLVYPRAPSPFYDTPRVNQDFESRYADYVYASLRHLVALPQGGPTVRKKVASLFQQGVRGSQAGPFQMPRDFNLFRIWNLGNQLWAAVEKAKFDRALECPRGGGFSLATDQVGWGRACTKTREAAP